jgi:hypothetical protein
VRCTWLFIGNECHIHLFPSSIDIVRSRRGNPLTSRRYFFQQAGLATTNSFNMTIGLYAAAFVGTVFSWFCSASPWVSS